LFDAPQIGNLMIPVIPFQLRKILQKPHPHLEGISRGAIITFIITSLTIGSPSGHRNNEENVGISQKLRAFAWCENWLISTLGNGKQKNNKHLPKYQAIECGNPRRNRELFLG